MNVEQMTDILDLKPLLSVEMWGVFLFLFLLLLLFALLLWRVWRRRTPKPVLPPPPPLLSPKEIALRDLEELDRLNLLEHGQFRKYYFRISEILRRFLQGEYGLAAEDATTEEISQMLHKIQGSVLESFKVENLHQMLIEMDLVKFAKVVPPRADVEGLRKRLQEFFVQGR